MTAMAVASPVTKPRLEKFRDVHVRGGRYRAHSEDDFSTFQRLVRNWRAETIYSSSLDEKYTNLNFVQIVKMGRRAVPLIISELRHGPDWLFGALHQITGEDPISEHDRGDLDAMTSAWIEWFNRRK